MFNKPVQILQGFEQHLGTNTIIFIPWWHIPVRKKVTYLQAVCGSHPQKKEIHCVQLMAVWNPIKYPGDFCTPTADITMIKCHWNSVLSDKSLGYMCMNVKNFMLEQTPWDDANIPVSNYKQYPMNFSSNKIRTNMSTADMYLSLTNRPTIPQRMLIVGFFFQSMNRSKRETRLCTLDIYMLLFPNYISPWSHIPLPPQPAPSSLTSLPPPRRLPLNHSLLNPSSNNPPGPPPPPLSFSHVHYHLLKISPTDLLYR